MFFIACVFLVCVGVVSLAGLGALVLGPAYHLRYRRHLQIDRNTLREENRTLKIGSMHTKAWWNFSKRVDAALRAVTIARDERRHEAELLDNAAEHIAAIARGD